MHPFDDDYLSKMLPGFEKKPRPEPAAPSQRALETSKPAAKAPSPQPASEIFDSIAAFISKYLNCDQHQLTVLTLWSVYTWTSRPFRTAVYLNVRSPEPQSGKSTCLTLLKELSCKPSFLSGVSAQTLAKYLLTRNNQVDGNKFDSTLILDECHHTFGPSERQPMVALLNSGSDASASYLSGSHEYYLFGPKTFAANAPLPESLAARCIPITLGRRKYADAITPFHPVVAHAHAVKLLADLDPWISRNREAIEKAALTIPPRIPPGHTPREQACAEPLVHLADIIGGAWPEKARAAVSRIFRLAEGTTAVELLCDLRSLFYNQDDPEFIATKDILAALRQLEHRPWSGWSRTSGKALGSLLGPLGIRSRFVNQKSASGIRGYYFEHLKDAWERYVPPILNNANGKPI